MNDYLERADREHLGSFYGTIAEIITNDRLGDILGYGAVIATAVLFAFQALRIIF